MSRHQVQVGGRAREEEVIGSGSENFAHPPLLDSVSDDCDQDILLVLPQKTQKVESTLQFIQRPHAYDSDECMVADERNGL
jgi:hypothetical protein